MTIKMYVIVKQNHTQIILTSIQTVQLPPGSIFLYRVKKHALQTEHAVRTHFTPLSTSTLSPVSRLPFDAH